MEHNLKDGIEKWKHIIAFVAYGVGACLISSAATIWIYRDFIQQQAVTHQAQVQTLTDQLTLERGETRKLLGEAMDRLVDLGEQVSAISDKMEAIAQMATRMTGEAAVTAKSAASTARSAAAAAKRAATSVREAVKELNEPPAPPPRKRRPKEEYIEP